MYLSLIPAEAKHSFLSLSYLIAAADGVFEQSEQELIESYCDEMFVFPTPEDQNASLEQVLQSLCSVCDEAEKRIVLFEALGLALCDNDYNKKEQEIIQKTANALGLSDDFCRQCESILKEYFSLQHRINTLVLQEPS